MTFDRFEKSWKFIHLDYFGTGLFYVAVKRTVKNGDYIHDFLSFFLSFSLQSHLFPWTIPTISELNFPSFWTFSI